MYLYTLPQISFVLNGLGLSNLRCSKAKKGIWILEYWNHLQPSKQYSPFHQDYLLTDL